MASVFFLNPGAALQKPHLLEGLRRGGEVKKRRLCKERGLMRLKKKYHFDGKGSFKITVENEAMSGEVMKIQVYNPKIWHQSNNVCLRRACELPSFTHPACLC